MIATPNLVSGNNDGCNLKIHYQELLAQINATLVCPSRRAYIYGTLKSPRVKPSLTCRPCGSVRNGKIQSNHCGWPKSNALLLPSRFLFSLSFYLLQLFHHSIWELACFKDGCHFCRSSCFAQVCQCSVSVRSSLNREVCHVRLLNAFFFFFSF